MQHGCVMQRRRTLIALSFCQHFFFSFCLFFLKGVTWSVCRGLHQATFRGKFESCFLSRHTHTHIERGRVKLLFPLKQWELRGDMQRCAHEWHGSGMCVGQWPGVSVPKPLSQRPTMNLHRVGTPRGHRPVPFVPHFKTHKHL